MPRKRRPVQMPIAEATEAVVWRATITAEMFSDTKVAPELGTALRLLSESLADYRASKNPVFESYPPIEIFVCRVCNGTSIDLHGGMCPRCFDKERDAKRVTNPTLTFAELQS